MFGSNIVEEMMSLKRMVKVLWSDDSGSEVVEFAISVCVWLACIFAIMYGSFALYASHFVANAAEEGARYAIVRGSGWNGASCSTSSNLDCTATSSDISNYISSSLPPGLSSSNLTVLSSWPGTTSTGATCDTQSGSNSQSCIVKVQVKYSFSFPLPFLTRNTIPLASSAEMTIAE
jgi:Flp pilus assembly protein TadG